MEHKYIIDENLKNEIKLRLRTFSQLQTKYKIDYIYRSSEEEHFSEKAKLSKIEGLPKSRPTVINIDYIYDDKPHEDILEPIWYATNYNEAIKYCGNKPNCNTYKYSPYDKSLVTVPSNNGNWLFPPSQRNKTLLFIDLTNQELEYNYDNKDYYYLDQPFIKKIYDLIFKKWESSFYTDVDDDGNDIDNDDIKWTLIADGNTFTKKEIKDTYGYNDGTRDSEYYIDKFFTIELFNIIKDSNIENEMGCRFMGYFHSNILGTNEGHLPAEFAIPYSSSISKTFINFLGKANEDNEHDNNDEDVGEKRKRRGGYKPTKRFKIHIRKKIQKNTKKYNFNTAKTGKKTRRNGKRYSETKKNYKKK